MEQRPLPKDDFPPPEIAEPRLELVPAVDDPAELDDSDDDVEIEAGLEDAEAEEVEEADEVEAPQPAAVTQDPLKLSVRSIGGGPLITRSEEREIARRKDTGAAVDSSAR